MDGQVILSFLIVQKSPNGSSLPNLNGLAVASYDVNYHGQTPPLLHFKPIPFPSTDNNPFEALYSFLLYSADVSSGSDGYMYSHFFGTISPGKRGVFLLRAPLTGTGVTTPLANTSLYEYWAGGDKFVPWRKNAVSLGDFGLGVMPQLDVRVLPSSTDAAQQIYVMVRMCV